MAAKPKSRPRKRITTMRLPPDLMKRVKTAAEKEGRSQANLVEKILADALKKRGEPADEPSIFS
jgi:hypothetical protein